MVALLVLVLASTVAPGKIEYEQAQALYLAERYGEALPLYEQAYLLSDRRPSTTFALAQCHRAMGQDEQALRYYEEYRASGLSDEEDARVANTIAALQTAIARARAAALASRPELRPEPPPSPPTAVAAGPPAPAAGPSLAPLLVGGAGLVMAVSGVIVGQIALADARAGLTDGVLTRGRVADGLLIGGVSVAVGGAVWWLLD